MSRHLKHLVSNRGQATIEFALLLPFVVVCAGVLISVGAACLSVLRLNDVARVTARFVAVGPLEENARNDLQRACRCELEISQTSGIITVRAERAYSLGLLGIPIPEIRLRSTSIAMTEPTIIFQPPAKP